MEVYSSLPERTSRQTGALLPGCDCARCCWVSPCCASDAPLKGKTRANARAKKRPQTAMGFMNRAPLLRPGVFVLGEIAGPDCGFPAFRVALAPLGSGVKAGGRIVFPGLGVGLALILSLLVDSHLVALAAGTKAYGDKKSGAREGKLAGRRHDFARAAAAEGALVHLAAQAKSPRLRELRRAERAGVEAVAAADAQILVVQYHAFVGAVETVHRAHCHAGRVRAVHAGNRNRLLGAHDAVVDRHDAPAVHAPGNLVLLLAGGDTAVALDAALGVAQEFHSGHGCLLVLFPL